MERYIKSLAPPTFISAVQQIEDRADECHRTLALFNASVNLATWTVLTVIIQRIERAIADKGYASPAHIAVMLNLSRAGAQAISWLQSSRRQSFVSRRALKTDPRLFTAADQLLSLAINYDAFTSNFPLWHKNFLEVELRGPSIVRFSGLGGENSRRARAYQQGIRPEGARPKQGSSLPFSPEAEQEVQQKIANLVQNAGKSEGPMSFSYGKPKRLWRMIYKTQLEAMNALFRHNDDLDLGGYSIGDFKRCYAGLLAVCAVHENACHLRGQMQQKYPFDSAVLVNNLRQWTDLLCEITSLKAGILEPIIRDLTFGETRVMDLYVHPFVPLSVERDLFGLVPHFTLNSRADENIIRVCSHLRPQIHSAISLSKEAEMRDHLVAASRAELRLRGPRMLPEPLPDIDLIVEDVASSTVIIAELKWLRKTVRPTEHPEREREFLNGAAQLKKIEEFLKSNLEYLLERGDVSQALRSVKNLYFMVVARDYFVWVDPAQGYAVIDYEPFLEMVKTPGSLDEQIRTLIQFNWLPVEGLDFRASYERATVNGVTVESEVFYANY